MPRDRATGETVRRVINVMVNDVVAETRRRIATLDPKSADDIRAARRPVVGFSDSMMEANNELRAFLFQRMYRHWRVNRTTQKCKRALQVLFTLLHGEPRQLPPWWQAKAGEPGSAAAAAAVCDYLAGMTDRYALEEYKRLTDPSIPG
jgi:dGTPase